MMITHGLYDIVHSGDLEGTIRWLDRQPDDLNAPIGDGYNPLHVACIFGHEPIVRNLVARHALVNVNAENASRATPLHLAVTHRDEAAAASIARFLIENGAELNARQAGGQTPLHHAVGSGSTELVRVLIRAGADPFLKDDDGRSPSHVLRDLPPGAPVSEIQYALKEVMAAET